MRPRANDDHLPVYVRVRQNVLSQAERMAGPGAKIPSIRELARICGASVPTVLKAVRLLAADGLLITRHGVGTFMAARTTSTAAFHGSMGLIFGNGMIVHADRVYMQIMAGICARLADSKYMLQFINTGVCEQTLADEIRRARLSGVIWVAPAQRAAGAIRQLESAGVRIVSLDLSARGIAACSLASDLHDEGYAMASELLRRGHRKIILGAGAAADSDAVRLFQTGFEEAFRGRGMKMDQRLNLPRDNFAARLETLIDMRVPFSALAVAGSLFRTALTVLRQKKLHVPRDVAVITEDDHLTFDLADPVPTRIARPLRQLGETAVQKLLNWATGGVMPRSEVLAWELIEGETLSVKGTAHAQ